VNNEMPTNPPPEIEELDVGHPRGKPLPVHDAIKLVVARMQSHPEEFWTRQRTTHPNGKVTVVNRAQHPMLTYIDIAKGALNRDERKAFNQALRDVRLGEAYHAMLEHLLAEKGTKP